MTIESPQPQGLIGARLTRVQDERMLRGRGRYVDDLSEAGVLHAAVIRSPIAAGRVDAVDATAARQAPGVVLVLTPGDIAPLVDPVLCTALLEDQKLTEWHVVDTTVRYVGQPLGLVVALSRAEAEDAAELVEIDFTDLPTVVGVDAARTSHAPLLYPDLGTNRIGGFHVGSPREELEAVFARAAHVVQRQLAVPRISHSPIEARGLVAEWEPATERLTITSSTQTPHVVRQEVARALRVRADQVHVIANDVGGSFGQKTSLFPDEAIVCLGAKLLGRKVKWIEDRSEALTASFQGRGTQSLARLALDENGRFLAIHADIHGDVGAFCASGTGGSGPFQTAARMLEGPYRYERAGATLSVWCTNAVPTTAFRGYGMQEGTWIRERLVDEAAREMGRDPVELRRLNMITPAHMPFTTHTGMLYDNGDYPEALRRAAGIGRQQSAGSTGRIRRGIGIASMVESTGASPSAQLERANIHWSGWESSTVRVNEDGSVTVYSGVTSVGQGVETAFTQIAAERLGIPPEGIRVQLGDTDTSSYSYIASQASRATVLGGGALWQAADQMRRRMHVLAANHLGVDPEEITQRGGVFHAVNGASATWAEVAHRGWMGWGRPKHDMIRLEESVDFDPENRTFGYATHGALVAVDLDTARVTVEAYWIVHDCGVTVNPLLAEGQIFGGTAMGLGSALYEECTYDENGQPTATTYLDYILPVSADVPDIIIDHLQTPSSLNPGGFKGLGESATIAAPVTIANAVAAAVPEIAGHIVAAPLHPSRIWGFLEAAGLTR